MLDLVRIPTARELYFPSSPHPPDQLREMERQFFGALQMRNGTCKLTYPHRLDDLNDLVLGLLPPTRPLRIMDVGASSGISTLEWSRHLDEHSITHTITASDIGLTAFLVSFGRHFHVLVDPGGYPLQYELYGHAVPNPPARRHLPFVWPLLALLRAGLMITFNPSTYVDSAQDGMHHWWRRRRIALVSPQLMNDQRIELLEEDVTTNTTLQRQFDVVRAANLLNRAYFSEDRLARIGAILRDRLVPGGLLIVCTTTGDCRREGETARPNDGTIFALRPSGELEVVDRIGAGSVVEDILLGPGPATRPAGP